MVTNVGLRASGLTTVKYTTSNTINRVRIQPKARASFCFLRLFISARPYEMSAVKSI
jgi:hypothetical protein